MDLESKLGNTTKCKLRCDLQRNAESNRSGSSERSAVILQRDVEDETHIADLRAGEVFEDRNQIEKLVVVRVGEPAADWNGVLRVEDV
jgi:predicted methyltransferase